MTSQSPAGLASSRSTQFARGRQLVDVGLGLLVAALTWWLVDAQAASHRLLLVTAANPLEPLVRIAIVVAITTGLCLRSSVTMAAAAAGMLLTFVFGLVGDSLGAFHDVRGGVPLVLARGAADPTIAGITGAWVGVAVVMRFLRKKAMWQMEGDRNPTSDDEGSSPNLGRRDLANSNSRDQEER